MALSPREQEMYGICVVLLVLSGFAAAFIAVRSVGTTGFATATPEPPAGDAPVPTAPVAIQNLTIQDAQNAIWEGERIMADLRGKGFNVQFINDTLIESRRVLQKVNYSIRLEEAKAKNDTETVQLLQDALALLSTTYSGATPQESYAEVLRLVDTIRKRQEPAYLLLDKLTITKQKLADYEQKGVPTERGAQLIAEAERSFRDERYEEAIRYVDEADAELERSRAESPLVRALQESSKGFLQKNWKQLLGMLVVFGLAGWFGWKRMEVYQLKRRIEHLKIELESIGKLMVQAQRDCFQEKKISKMTYDLRMDTYRKRRAEILVLLPTLEGELQELTKGKAKVELGPAMRQDTGALKVERPGAAAPAGQRERGKR